MQFSCSLDSPDRSYAPHQYVEYESTKEFGTVLATVTYDKQCVLATALWQYILSIFCTDTLALYP